MSESFWWFLAIVLTIPFWLPLICAAGICVVGLGVMISEWIKGK